MNTLINKQFMETVEQFLFKRDIRNKYKNTQVSCTKHKIREIVPKIRTKS